MKQYMLSINYPPGASPPAPEALQAIMRDVSALRREMKTAGAWVFSAGLSPPSTATVVRFQGSEMLITDGPYAEAKEQVGGFSIVNAADLDAALKWAEKLSRATACPIEVRPLQLHGEI